jgi:hypothetical protein
LGPHHFNAELDPPFHFNPDPDPAPHQGYAKRKSTTTVLAYRPSRPPSEPPSLHFERPRLHFEPRKLRNFDFNADPDPAFHYNTDLDLNTDPDSAYKADPDPKP